MIETHWICFNLLKENDTKGNTTNKYFIIITKKNL